MRTRFPVVCRDSSVSRGYPRSVLSCFAAAGPNGKIVYVINMGFPDYTTDMISGRAITTSEAV
jgi:hypothetical protein